MASFDPRQNKQPEGNTGLLVAVLVAVLVMIGWDYFNPTPQIPQAKVEEPSIVKQLTVPGAPKMVADIQTQAAVPSAAMPKVQRVAFHNNVMEGSIALVGGRIDELTLKQYTVELHGDKHVQLFSPSGKRIHFFDAGWQGLNVKVPDGNTQWQSKGGLLTEESPLVLFWNNGQGQEFTRTFILDKDSYVVKVVDEVINKGSNVQLAHYAQIHKADGLEEGGDGYEEEQSTFYNFIGPEGLIDGLKYEHDYKDLAKEKSFKYTGQKGWMGIKSRYFLAALIPDQQNEHSWQFKHNNLAGRDFYTALVQESQATQIMAGGTLAKSFRLYVGPNKRQLMEKEGVGLEDSVDYGWYQIIALPIYELLMYLGNLTGNLGVAIILVTVILKVLLLPLANKSYVSMAKMKQLTPKMEALKERLGDNREAMGLEMIKLYKEHKVNPASGCWPMLLQIPIFFAFYKTILISFEFRHAPFIGWIHDLSSYDHFFVLPILMGASMWFQQKLNPPAADPIQRQVMQALPIIFTIMFAFFPSGLVLYWLVNNVLSIAQQWVITRRIEALGNA